jgi:hypothetical protein
MSANDCVILYSGGTDSTCVAALLAPHYDRLHLLTFRERGTRGAPSPQRNVEQLREKFGPERFSHYLIPIDTILQHISYDRYLGYVARHGFFMLSTCGFSSLSWHVRTIVYCLDHGIERVADGLTRELMHFPGHMDGVLKEIRALYASFSIDYSNPIREWDVPADQRFLDRLIIDPHGFPPTAEPSGRPLGKTSGRYLYEQGLMPHPNVKGSALDRSMQHACYPFVLFNIFAFWYYLSRHEYADYEQRMVRLFREKMADLHGLLEDYRRSARQSLLASWLEPSVALSA